MLLSTLALLGVFLNSVVAAPAPVFHVLHERREDPARQWVKKDRLDGQTLLPVRIGLVQSNIEKGHSMLMEVAQHGSSKYGQYYTADEITEIFAPPRSAVDAIRSWLELTGIPAWRISQSANKQWMQFDASASELERLLQTEYHVYEHVRSGRTKIGCDQYHVPGPVKGHIDYITPGIKLMEDSGLSAPTKTQKKREWKRNGHKPSPPKPKPMPTGINAITASKLALCDVAITPPCIRAMYNFTKGTTATEGNELGIFEDLGDVYSQEDLDLFFQALAPYIPKGTHPTLDAIDGAVAPTSVANAGYESDLDFQISYPIIWPQNSILFQTDDPVYQNDYTYDGFLNNFFDALDGSYCTYSAYGETGNSPLDPPYPDPAPGGYKGKLECGVYKPTNVISISYGGAEAGLPISYQRRQCNEIMKLGMQGVSVVVASGDYGVASFPDSISPNGCLGDDGDIFAPDFPASCPYITSVGSTYLPAGADVYADAEVATTRFPSGGGFSNIYNRDDEAPYQSDAVNSYFSLDLVDYPYYDSTDNSSFGAKGGIYNRIGRAYPDVAAVGDNVLIFGEGSPTLIGGTSASAPAFAAILTRINEERLAKGLSTVGFVNPTLYANPQVFHDITNGNNSGCGTAGFYAGKGWDPVTGLGTPNYPALLEVFLS
ncbi:putative alkaline serine protease [Phaeomoniella chlamydospora]|uniref:tripeptidyl-peptidase II n=1 Tax=Phaeomoniella chlamydospora TaxID=158046 RepID=A0A0G2F0A5_PHACM|nr:putative alkaline serine protease [Phaeomoniella chlamydospora]